MGAFKRFLTEKQETEARNAHLEHEVNNLAQKSSLLKVSRERYKGALQALIIRIETIAAQKPEAREDLREAIVAAEDTLTALESYYDAKDELDMLKY